MADDEIIGQIADKLSAADPYALDYPLPQSACGCGECCERVTRAVLAEVEAAGRLLPSGGEVEWAVRRDHEGNGTHWVSEPFYRREHAEALLASMNGGGDPMYVVSRRIQAGPWQSTVLSDNSEVPNG